MLRLCVVAFLWLFLMPGFAQFQEEAYSHKTVVRQADRILIESRDPDALFKLFSETLQIPVAWPMSTNQTYTSGSVSAGDVTLEFYRYGRRADAPAQARCTSLYLEPFSLEESARKLRILGIPYGAPQFQKSVLPDGSEGTAWTTVQLPSLSSPSLPVALFEYSPVYLNMEVRRKQFGNRLTLNGGGPLGIVSTDTIVLESENPEKAEAAWVPFLGKADPDGRIQPEEGPAFRIVRGSRNGIRKIVFKVKSLDRAEAFLRKQGLLEKKQGRELLFKPSSVQGLRISVTE